MQKHLRFLLLLLSLCLMSGCVTAVKPGPAAQPASTDGQAVELQMYMLGETSPDQPEITAQLNTMSLRDLRCTVNLHYLPWAEWQQQYDTLLNSGQPADLIYTADWANYPQYARKGAFMPLDTLLPEVVPDLYAFIPEKFWEGVRIQGSVYTIPATWQEYVNNGLIYRDDLRKSLNLPVPDSLEHLEQYMSGIRRNAPDQAITLVQNSFITLGSGTNLFEVLQYRYAWATYTAPYGLALPYNDPTHPVPYWGSPDFLRDCRMFRQWFQAGYWSADGLSSGDNNSA